MGWWWSIPKAAPCSALGETTAQRVEIVEGLWTSLSARPAAALWEYFPVQEGTPRALLGMGVCA